MRTKCAALFSGLLILGLLLPPTVFAKRVTAGGSVSFSPSAGQLVVTAVLTNPGLEHVITQQLPLPGPIYTLPFVVNIDKGNPTVGDLDMILLITNVTGGTVTVTVTLYDAGGAMIGSPIILIPDFAAHETRSISISDLLP